MVAHPFEKSAGRYPGLRHAIDQGQRRRSLYDYNAKGEVDHTVSNVNVGSDPGIDLAGKDRVVQTVASVVQDHGTTVQRNETRVWGTDDHFLLFPTHPSSSLRAFVFSAFFVVKS